LTVFAKNLAVIDIPGHFCTPTEGFEMLLNPGLSVTREMFLFYLYWNLENNSLYNLVERRFSLEWWLKSFGDWNQAIVS